MAAIRHFRFLLEGRAFSLLTDHKPLTSSLYRISDAWSARQQRHLAYVAEYTSDIQHVSGETNIVADTLSRPPEAVPDIADRASVPPVRSTMSGGNAGASTTAAVTPATKAPPVNWAELAAAQSTWEGLEALRANSSLNMIQVEVEKEKLWCDTSNGIFRPVIPPQYRKQILEHIHGLTHPGVRATCRIASCRFVWPGMAKDVTTWCRECTACHRAKVTQQEKTKVEKIPIPKERFSHVHVDIVGPWPPSRAGYRYLVTMIDRSTRWLEATPIKNITAEIVLDTFIETWVSRFGVPGKITTDRGSQFTSGTWADWCGEMGVLHIVTSAFHPQSNGLVERSHRQIKDALRARSADEDWYEHLPWVLLGIRATPKDEWGVSAAEATLGQTLTVPGQLKPSLAVPQEGTCGPRVIPQSKREWREAESQSPVSDTAEYVYVKRGMKGTPLAQNYAGPYHVMARGEKVCKVKMGERTEVISRDRIKPHRGEVKPEVALPRTRGRPPGSRVAR